MPGPAARRPARGATAAAEPGLGPQAAATLELAAAESSGLGNTYVGCEHLALGLIGEPDGVAGSVLRSLGADLRVTRRTVAAALAGWGAGTAAHEHRSAQRAAASQDAGPAGLVAERAAPAAEQLSAALQADLAPVLARIERLESLTAS